MTSSKKKRGKQRKAAKLAAASRDGDGRMQPNRSQQQQSELDMSSTDVGMREINRSQRHQFVTSVLNGHAGTTKLLAEITPRWYKSMAAASDEGLLFENSGILSFMLDALNLCEVEKFDKVMADLGGDLSTPFMWVQVLLSADEFEPSCGLQIAQSIGPLVRCMCADTKRLFFKSNKHWREAILPFVGLIYTMITRCNNESDDEEKNIVDTLLQHEGLLRTIVQWGFWEEGYRPDIARELDVYQCSHIVDWGKEITNHLLVYAENDEVISRRACIFEWIATTPIVTKDYDSSCMISFVVGVIHRLKVGKTKSDVAILQLLLSHVDCADKGVITEIIDFGINCTLDHESSSFAFASFTVTILALVVVKKTSIHVVHEPNDSRVAFAIRVGLVEMCLNFIERFGGHELFEQTLFHYMKGILKDTHVVSLHLKSAKAVRSKRSTIEEKLVRLEQQPSITNNVKCKELIDMVRSILNLNGAYCCRCNISLRKKDIKRCNGCNRMTYCSKSCQKEDWLNGHNVTCNKEYIDEQSGQFQGRIFPDTLPENKRAVDKLEQLEVNITMVQLNLFLDHSETILKQASSLNIPLCDCVVTFDLRDCPFTIATVRYTIHYDSAELEKAFDGSRSKDNITCIYWSNVYNGELDEDGDIPILEMQRFFPHEWLWKKAKKN